MDERTLEATITVISNIVMTLLVIIAVFEEFGITLPKLILLTPKVLRMLIERYFYVFIITYNVMLILVLFDTYAKSYLKKYREVYIKKYLPTVSSILLGLSIINFIVFRTVICLIILVCSAVTLVLCMSGEVEKYV